MFQRHVYVVFSVFAFFVFSLLFPVVARAQERDPISMEVGETREFFGARVCSGFESSYSVDDKLPDFIDLETISVIQSTSSITGVTTARIRFSLTVALDAPTGIYPVDISYTLNRPGGECIRDFAYDLTITPAQPPVAEFVAERTLVAEGANVAFTDLSEHAIGSWSWDFGDGGSSNERNPEYSYTSEGVYTVTLAVTGPVGNDTEVKSDYITVRPEGAPGVLRWSFDTGGAFGSPAIAPDGTIFIRSRGNEEGIHAISPAGSRLWWRSTFSRPASGPVIGEDGTVFVGTNSGLEAFSPDGNRLWSVNLQWGGDEMALSHDGVLYVASVYDLIAFDTGGNELWRRNVRPDDVEDYLSTFPTVDIAGTVYAVSLDSILYAIDPAGNVSWTYQGFGSPFGSGPVIGRDNSLYYGTDDGLQAIGPDGTESWRFPANAGGVYTGSFYAPTLGLDNNLFVIEDAPSDCGAVACLALRALDLIDGSLLWSFKVPKVDYLVGGISPAQGQDGTLYFGSSDGVFYAVDSGGNEKWRFTTAGRIFGTPAIGGDGSVYFTDEDRLYALGSSNIEYAGAPWPRGEGRDGRSSNQAVNQYPRGLIDSPDSDVAIEAGQSVSFSATVLDEDPGNAEILWDFDGQATSSTVEDPGAITFNSAGTYTVSLLVTDALGLVDPDPPAVTVTVTAPNQPPDGTITSPAGNTTITVGDSLSFAGSASDENPGTVDYLWDFDGAVANSTSATPGSITFSSVGIYTVSLTVTDDEGQADPTPATVTITVNPPSGTLIHADGFE